MDRLVVNRAAHIQQEKKKPCVIIQGKKILSLQQSKKFSLHSAG